MGELLDRVHDAVSRSHILKKKKKIHLAEPGLSCSTYGSFSWGMWDLVTWSVIKLGLLHWELGILATEPPGKSQIHIF